MSSAGPIGATAQQQRGFKEGNDWFVGDITCIIKDKLENLKDIWCFTIRSDEALKENANCFCDFKTSGSGPLYEIAFQLFLKFGEKIADRLQKAVSSNGGSLQDTGILQFYVEALIDEDEFIKGDESVWKRMFKGYTFYICVKDIGSQNIHFRGKDIFRDIIKEATSFASEGKEFYMGGQSHDDTSLDDIANGGLGEDPSDYEFIKKPKGRKGRQNRDQAGRQDVNDRIKSLPKHQYWKLLKNPAMTCFIFDMLMHNLQLQVNRVDEMTHSYATLKDNPADPNILYGLNAGFFARPKGLVQSQSYFNIPRILQIASNGTKTLQFPMRKYVFAIPVTDWTVQRIINNKLPENQAHNYAATKIVTLVLDKLESAIGDAEAMKVYQDLPNMGKETSIVHWESEYNMFQKVLKEMNRDGSNYGDSESMFSSSESESEDSQDDDYYRTLAMRRMQATRAIMSDDIRPVDGHFDIDAHARALVEIHRRDLEESDNAVNGIVNEGMKQIIEISKKFKLDNVLSTALKTRGHNIKKLSKSQIENATTTWQPGTEINDGESVNQNFISIFAMLAGQGNSSKRAIENIFSKIDEEKISSDKLENPEIVKRKLLKIHKEQMMADYIMKARSKDSYGLSPYEKCIIDYISGPSDPYGHPAKHEKAYADMDILTDQECQRYAQLNCIFNIAEQHRITELAWQYGLDALRMQFDVHMVMFLFSADPERGKTNAANTVKGFNVQGTTRFESTRTAKADATSQRNMNGVLYCWDELPAALIDDRDDNDQSKNMKEKMSNGGITTGSRLQRKEDGSFVQEFIYSENICSIIGTTNMNLYQKLSKAFKSRAHCIYIEDTSDPYRTILEAKIAEEMYGQPLSSLVQSLRSERRLIQCMVFEIERLIYINCLDDVTMDGTLIFLLILQHMLKEKGKNVDSVRVFHRLKILTRLKCILECIERNWFQKGAKFYGQRIRIEQFLELDSMLFATVAQVVSAVGEAYDTLIDTASDTVYKCVQAVIGELDSNTKYRSRVGFITVEGKYGNREQRIYLKDPTWYRIDVRSGAREFYSLVSRKSAVLGLNAVSKETVMKVFADWATTRVYSPLKKYSRPQYDAATGLPEEVKDKDIVNETDFEGNVIKKELPVIEVAGTSLYLLADYFKCGKERNSMKDLQDCVKDILSCSRQLSGNYGFANTESKFPFIRDILSIDPEERGDNDVRRILAMPSVNIMKESMRKILSSNKSLANLRKLKKNDDGVIEDSMEEEDNESGSQSGKSKSYEIGGDIGDILTMTIDLDSFAMRKRNQLLHITPDAINGNYKTFSIFTGQVKETRNFAGMSDIEKKAMSFKNDRDYIPDENTGQYSDGYFMGEKLSLITKGELRHSEKELMGNVLKFYRELDTVDELSSEDHDFDKEYYVISRFPSMDKRSPPKTVYHWDMLEGVLRDPRNYKLVRHHPRIFNDFINRKYYASRTGQKKYPEELVADYSVSRRKLWEQVKNMKITDEGLADKVERGEIQLLGYVTGKGKNGETTLIRDSECPYAAIELNFQSKKRQVHIEEDNMRDKARKIMTSVKSGNQGVQKPMTMAEAFKKRQLEIQKQRKQQQALQTNKLYNTGSVLVTK